MSLSLKGVTSWAGEHPVETGIGVFAIGLAVLWMLGFFKPAASSSSSGTEANGSSTALDSAYLTATGDQSTAQAATQIASINANASTAQAQIASNTTLGTNQIWATQEQQVNSDNLQGVLNQGELSLDSQYETDAEKNAANQYGLNVIQGGGISAFDALVDNGYYTNH